MNDSIAPSISKNPEIPGTYLGFESADFVFDKPIPSSPLIDPGFDQRCRSVDMYPCGFSENFFLVFIFKVILRFKKKLLFTLFGGFVDRT